MIRPNPRFRATVVAASSACGVMIVAISLGCASNGPGESSLRSGFLGDYSQLAPGLADQARLIYIDPEADFSRYHRIIVDPVVVWSGPAESGGERTGIGPVPADELAGNARYLAEAMRRELGVEYAIVEEVGPETMRLRMAITRLHFNPDSGTTHDVGIEVELIDTDNGRRLIAAADGNDAGADAADSEGFDVRAAFDDWAQRASVRLSALRSFDEKRERP